MMFTVKDLSQQACFKCLQVNYYALLKLMEANGPLEGIKSKLRRKGLQCQLTTPHSTFFYFIHFN